MKKYGELATSKEDYAEKNLYLSEPMAVITCFFFKVHFSASISKGSIQSIHDSVFIIICNNISN